MDKSALVYLYIISIETKISTIKRITNIVRGLENRGHAPVDLGQRIMSEFQGLPVANGHLGVIVLEKNFLRVGILFAPFNGLFYRPYKAFF